MIWEIFLVIEDIEDIEDIDIEDIDIDIEGIEGIEDIGKFFGKVEIPLQYNGRSLLCGAGGGRQEKGTGFLFPFLGEDAGGRGKNWGRNRRILNSYQEGARKRQKYI